MPGPMGPMADVQMMKATPYAVTLLTVRFAATGKGGAVIHSPADIFFPTEVTGWHLTLDSGVGFFDR
jgi:hypothetical protein